MYSNGVDNGRDFMVKTLEVKYFALHVFCNFLRFWVYSMEKSFFLQLFEILVYNILKHFIRFPLFGETAEFIEQCYKNVGKFSFYL